MIPFSILDLSPITEGGDAAQSFRNTLDLAQRVQGTGVSVFAADRRATALYLSPTKALAAEALNAKQRIVLLDTRVTSVWQTAHIAGSFPLPYYSNFDEVTAALREGVGAVGGVVEALHPAGRVQRRGRFPGHETRLDDGEVDQVSVRRGLRDVIR